MPRRAVEREARDGGGLREDTLAKTKAAGGSKRNQSAAKVRAHSAVRLRDSDWYARASRSIGISDNRDRKSRDAERAVSARELAPTA
jgi:hypothetical protein